MNTDKIMRLVALTSSPQIEEARTAAYLACKAIREGGLVLVPRDDPRARWQPPPPPPPPRPEPPPRRPEPPPPPPRSTYADAKAKAQDLPRKLITLQFKGWCKVCRNDIPADSKAWWLKGDGCVCVGCYKS